MYNHELKMKLVQAVGELNRQTAFSNAVSHWLSSQPAAPLDQNRVDRPRLHLIAAWLQLWKGLVDMHCDLGARGISGGKIQTACSMSGTSGAFSILPTTWFPNLCPSCAEQWASGSER